MGRSAEPGRVIAQNRKARYNYAIEERIEAGIVLMGSEVKSLRAGRANIGEAYAVEREGALYLINAHISPYAAASTYNGHEPTRPRKLLLRSREIARLVGAIQREGMTLVPLSLYFNARGIAKVALGLAAGKTKQDKRATIKERDWQREKRRLLHSRG